MKTEYDPTPTGDSAEDFMDKMDSLKQRAKLILFDKLSDIEWDFLESALDLAYSHGQSDCIKEVIEGRKNGS